MRKSDLPTPALVVDLDLMEANVAAMQTVVASAGKQLRPHAKAHKRAAIARRQVEAGAVGVCCATLGEMETMVRAGISVLLTTPVAAAVKTDRIAALAALGDVTVVVDHPFQVALYADSAARAGVVLNTLVDLDIGDHRTGVPCDGRAVSLALAVEAAPALRFGGLQAYSVSGSHTLGHAERRAHSTAALALAAQVQHELLARGLNATRLTGGSTGTWDIDIEIPQVTEMQAGSYPLMDVAYSKIGGVPFAVAMAVLATVISASHPGCVTVDAGFKAFATDRPFGPAAIGVEAAQWQWAGDEHGFLFAPELPKIGEQVAFAVPHCDPTVNLHEKMYACRGEFVAEVWTR
ncbi:MAG: alanine racemase [Bryobacterales bacterium]|nr:alanine racemase [Bryobacterales bacterium]